MTTVRASTPMYLLARRIKAMGVKMVLSGEGSDEVFGGYLNFHKAPRGSFMTRRFASWMCCICSIACMRDDGARREVHRVIIAGGDCMGRGICILRRGVRCWGCITPLSVALAQLNDSRTDQQILDSQAGAVKNRDLGIGPAPGTSAGEHIAQGSQLELTRLD